MTFAHYYNFLWSFSFHYLLLIFFKSNNINQHKAYNQTHIQITFCRLLIFKSVNKTLKIRRSILFQGYKSIYWYRMDYYFASANQKEEKLLTEYWISIHLTKFTYHTTPHQSPPLHFTSLHTTRHQLTSFRTASQHTTLHLTTPLHTTSHLSIAFHIILLHFTLFYISPHHFTLLQTTLLYTWLLCRSLHSTPNQSTPHQLTLIHTTTTQSIFHFIILGIDLEK